MDRANRVFILLTALVVHLNLWGQHQVLLDTTTTPAHYLHYEVENGLLQNSIKQLEFDNAGFLWIANYKGVSRFDGRSFKHYIGEELNTWSRQFAKADSALYFGFDQRLVITNGKLIPDTNTQLDKPLIFNVGNQGLNYEGQLKFNILENAKEAHVHNIPYNFFQLEDGSAYVQNADGGLDYYENDKFIGEVFKDPSFDSKLSYANGLSRLFLLGNLPIYLDKESNELIELRKEKVYRRYSMPVLDCEVEKIRIRWRENGPVYFHVRNIVYQLKKKGDQICLKKIAAVPEGNVLSAIEMPNKEGIFIGTEKNGFYKLIYKDFTSLYAEENESRNSIRSLFEVDSNGVVLTDQGFLFNFPSKPIDVVSPKIKLSFKNDADKYNFLRATQKYQASNPDTLISLFPDVPEYPFNGFGIHIIDSMGVLWFVTEDMVMRLGENPDIFKVELKKGLFHRGAFYNPYQNEIWSAFREGIRVFSIEDSSFRWIPEFDGLHVRNVVFGKDVTWVCPVGKPLHSWDGKKLIEHPLDPYEATRYSHTVVDDGLGFLWISTDNGLFKVGIEELIYSRENPEHKVLFHRFNKNNGFRNNEFNGSGFPCGLKLSNGNIAFASMDGGALFNPSTVKLPSIGNGLIIDHIKIDGKDTTFSSEMGLNQNMEQMDIQLAFAYFGNIQNVVIEYQIEGIHEHWYPVPNDLSISLRQLKYGNYALKVRRKDGFEMNDYTYLNYSFKVNPFFYQTQWFKILSIFIISLLVAGAFILKSYTSKLKQQRLEKIIQEKTQEQVLLNEELKLNLAKVRQSKELLHDNAKLKDKFMRIYVHDVRGPLRFVRTVIDSSIKNIEKTNTDKLIQLLDNIKTSTHQVYLLTERMFGWLGAQQEQVELQNESFSLNELLLSLFNQFSKQAESKNIKLVQTRGKDFTVVSDKNVLTIVLSNILDNSVKFTQNGSVIVEAYQLKDHLVINLTDTGVGMDEQKLMEMQNGVFTSESGTQNEKGTGFGLKTIKQLLTMVDGYMEIESEKNKGTSVSIFLKRE